MELLLGAITALLIQGGKKLVDKLGWEITSLTILLGAFVFSLIFTLLTFHGILTREMFEYLAMIWGSSVATYEIVLKRILPIYNLVSHYKKTEEK